MTALLRSFHSCCVKVREGGGWKRGRRFFTAFLAIGEIRRHLKNVWSAVAYQEWHYYGDRVSRLSFILALTIYAFHLLLFSNITPQVSITKEPAISENRDVSYVLEKEAGQQAAGCLSSLPAASGKCLWSAGFSQLSNPPSSFSSFTLTLIYRDSFTPGSLTGSHFGSVITKKTAEEES